MALEKLCGVLEPLLIFPLDCSLKNEAKIHLRAVAVAGAHEMLIFSILLPVS